LREADRVLVHRVCEFRAADPLGEPGVVLDPEARARLSAGHLPLDDQGAKPLGGGVDGGRQAGRPAPTIVTSERFEAEARRQAQLVSRTAEK
jgi:hypothetical protein